jgi:hypothetical protein
MLASVLGATVCPSLSSAPSPAVHDQGVRFENRERLNTVCPDSGKPNPEKTLSPAQAHAFMTTVIHDGELMAKHEDLEMESRATSEHAYEGAEKRIEDCLHASDAMMVTAIKSTEPTCTRYSVGTAH